jgi:hypothetical protein
MRHLQPIPRLLHRFRKKIAVGGGGGKILEGKNNRKLLERIWIGCVAVYKNEIN